MFEIHSTLKSTPKVDGVLFSKIKDKVLGKNFEVNLVFVGKKRMRTLNKEYREKDYTTDILSFNVSEDVGEIFINPDKCRTKCKEFDRNFINYISFIFIHGLMHLKGFDHSSRMDSEEEKIRRVFGI